jgi:hypothetical protein
MIDFITIYDLDFIFISSYIYNQEINFIYQNLIQSKKMKMNLIFKNQLFKLCFIYHYFSHLISIFQYIN